MKSKKTKIDQLKTQLYGDDDFGSPKKKVKNTVDVNQLDKTPIYIKQKNLKDEIVFCNNEIARLKADGDFIAQNNQVLQN